MVPVDKNIRWRGFSKPQRANVAIPAVKSGDWLASRDGQLYYYRLPWEGAPFVTQPALHSLGEDSIGEIIGSVIGGTQNSVADQIAGQAATSVVDQLRPYLVWGALGVGVLMLMSGFVGYNMGRGV